jgi:hypothetical protein
LHEVGGDSVGAGNDARINKGGTNTKRKWDFLEKADNNAPMIYAPHANPTWGMRVHEVL